MNRVIITILLCCMLPASALAGSYYYTKPDATSLPPSGRILVYDPNTGTDKNITGQVLRDQVQPSTDETLTTISQPSDKPLSVQPATSANPYQRKLEVRDASGKITMYATANGTMVFGTPVPLAVTSISPVNGATGVSIAAIPQLGTNINFEATISNLYVVNSSVVPVDASGAFAQVSNLWNIPATLQPNTTYIIRFNRGSIVQTSGETTSSCGTAMADMGNGLCQSIFTTAP